MSGLRCIAMHDRNLRAVSHCKSGFLLKNINCIWCYPSKTHVLGEAVVVCDDHLLQVRRNRLSFFPCPAILLWWGCRSSAHFWVSSDEHVLVPLKRMYIFSPLLFLHCVSHSLALSSAAAQPLGSLSPEPALSLQCLCWPGGYGVFLASCINFCFAPTPWGQQLPHCCMRAPVVLLGLGHGTVPCLLPCEVQSRPIKAWWWGIEKPLPHFSLRLDV